MNKKSKKLLTENEEIDLRIRFAKGEPDAEGQMVMLYHDLVEDIANAYSSMAPIEDSIQEGNIGLLEVLRSFAPKKGYGFETYARVLIRKYNQ